MCREIDAGHAALRVAQVEADEREPTACAQDAAAFAQDCGDVVGVDEVEHEARRDGVERGVAQRQMTGVGLQQGMASQQLGRGESPTAAQCHAQRQVNADQMTGGAAPYRYARQGGPVKTEDDPLDASPPPNAQETYAAMTRLDRAVTEAGGTALRYGGFYGAANDGLINPVRKRQFPIVGDGGGIMSFIHLEDAAAATVLAVEQDRPGIYNIVDDEPAPVREWLPVLADALGAKPARHGTAMARAVHRRRRGGRHGHQARGASNAKAERELGWTLRYPSWRQGFPAAYASSPDSASRSLNPSRPDQPVAPPPARHHHGATATAQPKDRVVAHRHPAETIYEAPRALATDQTTVKPPSARLTGPSPSVISRASRTAEYVAGVFVSVVRCGCCYVCASGECEVEVRIPDLVRLDEAHPDPPPFWEGREGR